MSAIQNLFQQAELAEAAYANLWDSALNSFQFEKRKGACTF
jgi:hypothetical protein